MIGVTGLELVFGMAIDILSFSGFYQIVARFAEDFAFVLALASGLACCFYFSVNER